MPRRCAAACSSGETFDPHKTNVAPQLGSVEEWTLRNNSPDDHPFHIHVNDFQVSVNAKPCHILGHEDAGMMQTVQVVRKGERPTPPPATHAMLLAPKTGPAEGHRVERGTARPKLSAAPSHPMRALATHAAAHVRWAGPRHGARAPLQARTNTPGPRRHVKMTHRTRRGRARAAGRVGQLG